MMNSRGLAALPGVRAGDCVGEVSMTISPFKNAAASEVPERRQQPPDGGEARGHPPSCRRPPNTPPLSLGVGERGGETEAAKKRARPGRCGES